MNNKATAFWNITLFITIILSIILAFQNFESHQLTIDLWEEYTNQEIGTDKVLTNKVQNIENNLSSREDFKFTIEDSPTELSNVIIFDGFDSRFSSSSKYIYVTAIISSPISDKRIAIVRYRDDEYTVTQGDSIAGGYISLITEKEVLFNKKDKKYKFYRGLDTSLNDEEIILIETNEELQLETQNINSKQYSLQSGAFGIKQNALLQQNNLINAGFNARIVEYNTQNNPLYIVKIGFYNELNTAREIGKKIFTNLKIETIIVNNN